MIPIEVKVTIEFGENAFKVLGHLGITARDLLKNVKIRFEDVAPKCGDAAAGDADYREIAAGVGAFVGEVAPVFQGPEKLERPRRMQAESKSSGIAGVGSVWTVERKLLMATMRGLQSSWQEVCDSVNELPGPKCSGALAAEKAYYKFKKAGELPAVSYPAPPITETVSPPVVSAPVVSKPNAAPADRVAVMRRIAAAQAGRVEPPVHLAGAGKMIVVDTGHARQWAAERGLCNGGAKLDLPMVNKKRRDLGLPEFELAGGAKA